jgi:lipid-A-disaccharide synthase
MRAAGCDTVVDAKELSVVGISEILSHLPKIWGLFHKLISEADRRKPDLAIVIDSPAFNWRVARQMHKRGIPVIYYVCPQFWAWRQGRVRLLRKYVNKALVIWPTFRVLKLIAQPTPRSTNWTQPSLGLPSCPAAG